MLMQVNMTDEQRETPPCHSWLDGFIYMRILTASRMECIVVWHSQLQMLSYSLRDVLYVLF